MPIRSQAEEQAARAGHHEPLTVSDHLTDEWLPDVHVPQHRSGFGVDGEITGPWFSQPHHTAGELGGRRREVGIVTEEPLDETR